MFDPTPEQKVIIEGENHALINAGPGTGKSVTAIEMARQMAKDIKKPQTVLFLSFSNAAVNRLAATAGISLDQFKSRLSFMTYHALAWEIVKTYGRLWGLSNRLTVLDEIEFSMAVSNGFLNPDNNTYEDHMEFSKKHGKVSFDIMVPLATKILRSSPEIRRVESSRFPLIVADEFQDTREDQWALLKELGDSSRVVAFGDLNQVIYGGEFARAKDLFEDFKSWKEIDESPFSRTSHRCKNSDILDFSYATINGVKARLTSSSVQVKTCYRNQMRTTIAAICADLMRRSRDQGKTIGILTTNAMAAQKLAVALKLPPQGTAMPMPIYARVPLAEAKKEAIRLATLALYQLKKNNTPPNKESAAKALMTMKANWSRAGRVRGVTANILKELEAPRNKRSKRPLFELINSGDDFDIRLFEEKFIDALRLSSEFETIGENVKSIGRSFVNNELELSSQMEFPFEHFRETRSAKGLYGDPIYQNSVEILSMWKSKGREFDHVIVLFDPRELSANVSIETERRLLYVACTRAKEWLGIIYPERSPGQVLAQVLGLR